jgi:hypothetical protein
MLLFYESGKGILSFLSGAALGIVTWISEFIINLLTVVIVAFLPIGLAVVKTSSTPLNFVVTPLGIKDEL